MYKFIQFVLIFLLCYSFAGAQSTITGTIVDKVDGSPLSGAIVRLVNNTDSGNVTGALTNESGVFIISDVISGGYKLRVNYLGYSELDKPVVVNSQSLNVGVLQLVKSATNLKEVEVVEQQVRVVQKEDTSEYNAAAFKTSKDASAEDLVTKMPGIVNENGTIKAQGEQIQKVTIDGKDFFGDDASLALKNIPAEVVDKVQVYDRMNDQSSFTGFDDGNSKKAMNIVTKNGMNNGLFGKLYAGYGYIKDSRYSTGGNINWFKGDMRLSVIGMSNNINQQNFSMQDILGVTGTQSGGGGGRAMLISRGGGGRWGNSAANNFLVGQQGGISTTHAAGVNYTDVWGKAGKFKISGSYFFNMAGNENRTLTNRSYFNTGDSAIVYNEQTDNSSSNTNHRINLRMEYAIDSQNTLIFTPKVSFQKNSSESQTIGKTGFGTDVNLSSSKNNYGSDNKGYNTSGELIYQHKFGKPFRTLSLTVATTIGNQKGETTQYAENQYADSSGVLLTDQTSNSLSNNYKVNGSIQYTEPAGKSGMIQISYDPSYTWSKADKRTLAFDSASGSYSVLDSSLSSLYNNTYMTQRGGLSYRLRGKKFNAMAGINFQYADLNGKSEFPNPVNVKKSFYNVLPIFTFNYRFDPTSNIRIIYRSSTNPPTVSQLQNAVDNSNTLLLSSGNPDLKQTFNHFAMMRYGRTDKKTSHSLFVFLSMSYVQNYITNSTVIATKDTLIDDVIYLRAGSQLTRPVNINGNLTLNNFFTYGLPVSKIKSNLNFNAGFTYSRTPSLINNLQNWSNTYGVNGGFVLSSNISDKIDFTLSYFGNYNVVKNTLQKSSDNNYFKHSGSARFNWQFWKGFIFSTDLQNTLYAGVSNGFNQNIFIWNAGFGYKFFKDQSLEVRATVNDILSQNSGVNRTVTETYVEDTQTRILRRFWLLTVTYTPRFYKKQS